MITRLHVHGADVLWATPTSGYGHLADEQPLPYVHDADGLERTPRFGGEASWPECTYAGLGLPTGVLGQNWSPAQRAFNLLRRNVNLYWRNVFTSRCRADHMFHFAEQLDFYSTADGFAGASPLLLFQRRFSVDRGSVHVNDCTVFKRSLHFAYFMPVVVPLFSEWQCNGMSVPRLETATALQQCKDAQYSSAGSASLWVERIENCRFSAGDKLHREFTYRWTEA